VAFRAAKKRPFAERTTTLIDAPILRIGMDDSAITSACLTIDHLADHFDRLKGRVDQMVATFGASQRGHFTPDQDDEVHNLLVSYCQSRTALLDLVHQVLAEQSSPEAADRVALLIGYAAAILLVDAASFVRDRCDDRPVVVAKLNEPEPAFGIPEGVYDTIQKSLTNPAHAWHLHQVNHFVDQHRDDLARIAAADERLAAVWRVIERLGHAVDVTPARYAQARLAIRGQGIADKLARTPLAMAVYQLQTFVCSLVAGVHTLPLHMPRLPQPVVQRLRSMLEPGDVIIVRKEYAITNYFLPGYWPHAALFLGDVSTLQRRGLNQHETIAPRWNKLIEIRPRDDHRVLEAMKDGVRIRSLQSPLASDAIAILRPQLAPADVATALGRAMFHEGKAYDFDFDFTRSDRLVCTEVIYRGYDGVGGIRFHLTRRSGRLTLSAEDLLRMAVRGEYFEPLAVYAPDYRKRLCTGGDAKKALEATL
jgi:hypothetical protein